MNWNDSFPLCFMLHNFAFLLFFKNMLNFFFSFTRILKYFNACYLKFITMSLADFFMCGNNYLFFNVTFNPLSVKIKIIYIAPIE